MNLQANPLFSPPFPPGVERLESAHKQLASRAQENQDANQGTMAKLLAQSKCSQNVSATVTVVQASWTVLVLFRHFLLPGWAGREADGPFKMEEEADPLLEAFCHSPESTKLFLALRVEPLITGAISVTWILCIPVAVPAVPAEWLHSLCFSHKPKLLSPLCYCSGILKKEI